MRTSGQNRAPPDATPMITNRTIRPTQAIPRLRSIWPCFLTSPGGRTNGAGVPSGGCGAVGPGGGGGGACTACHWLPSHWYWPSGERGPIGVGGGDCSLMSYPLSRAAVGASRTHLATTRTLPVTMARPGVFTLTCWLRVDLTWPASWIEFSAADAVRMPYWASASPRP